MKGKNFNVEAIGTELCNREGKKVEVSRGNIREILACLSDIIYEGRVGRFTCAPKDILDVLYLNGERRSKRRKTK